MEEKNYLEKILDICKNTEIPEELIKEENCFNFWGRNSVFIKTSDLKIRLGIRTEPFSYTIDCKDKNEDEEYHWSNISDGDLVKQCFLAYRERLEDKLKEKFPRHYNNQQPLFDSYTPSLGPEH